MQSYNLAIMLWQLKPWRRLAIVQSFNHEVDRRPVTGRPPSPTLPPWGKGDYTIGDPLLGEPAPHCGGKGVGL